MTIGRGAALALLGVVLVAWAAVEAAGRPPDIVYIVGDDIGYGDIGPFGARDIPTMNLDRLAEQGMRFTRFYAPSSTCTPSCPRATASTPSTGSRIPTTSSRAG